MLASLKSAAGWRVRWASLVAQLVKNPVKLVKAGELGKEDVPISSESSLEAELVPHGNLNLFLFSSEVPQLMEEGHLLYSKPPG